MQQDFAAADREIHARQHLAAAVALPDAVESTIGLGRVGLSFLCRTVLKGSFSYRP
jgi:hypothetical protein